MNSSSSELNDSERYSTYQRLLMVKPMFVAEKINLLFDNLPSFENFNILLEKNTFNLSCDQWNEEQLLLLQLTALSTNPDCVANRFDWEHVQRLLGSKRSPNELYFAFQQFYKETLARTPWSEFEDHTLAQIIKENFQTQKKKWNHIADLYNEQSHSKIIRNAKQCRERWNNKLDPEINRDQMSANEEYHFINFLLEYGRKWADISIKLSCFTDYRRRTEFFLKYKYRMLQKYMGKTSQLNHNTIKINKVWTQKQVNMLLYRLEKLEQEYQLERRKKTYKIESLFGQNMERDMSLIVIMRQKYVKIDCHEFHSLIHA